MKNEQDYGGKNKPIVYLTRRETFCASHRLHSRHLNDEENEKIFGKCNNANGHGHNYTVEVKLRGEVDEKTGMVKNLQEVKTLIQEAVTSVLDHRNIDKDVQHFNSETGVPSTAENIVVFIWHRLKRSMSQPDMLYKVKLFETDKNIATYKGEIVLHI